MWTPEVWYGGAIYHTLSADYEIVDRRVRVFAFAPSAGGFDVRLPLAERLPLGFGIYWIANIHGSNSLELRTNSGSLLATLAGNGRAICSLFSKDTADGTWVVRTS